MGEVAPTNLQEPLQYWCGPSTSVFRRNKLPNDKLDRLLRGIASSISSSFGQEDHKDLTPSQLAAFYQAVGGNYDPLFRETPPQSIAFIYKSLGCLHSLQPNPSEDGYAPPCVPALKPKGFVTWQTIQLLLGPEEHVPFLQRALRQFNVVDPEDGTPFPKFLPKEAFPARPDAHMIEWYQAVSARLRQEAEVEERADASGRSSTDGSVDESAGGERAHAVQYFSNPFYRNREGRPSIVRHITKAPAQLLRGGQMVVHTVRNIADTHLWSPLHSPQGHQHHSDDGYESDGPTPLAVPSSRASLPQHRHNHGESSRRESAHHQSDSSRRGSAHHHDSPRRESAHQHNDSSRHESAQRDSHLNPLRSPRRGRRTNYSSESDDDYPRRRAVRRPRSHEPPHSPRETFEHRSPNTSIVASTRPLKTEQMMNQDFGPSDSPPFAVKVANLQQPGYFELTRPSLTHRASYEQSTGTSESLTHRPSYDHGMENPTDNNSAATKTLTRYRATSAASGPWPASARRPSTNDDYLGPRRPRGSVDVTALKGVHGRRYLDESPWH